MATSIKEMFSLIKRKRKKKTAHEKVVLHKSLHLFTGSWDDELLGMIEEKTGLKCSKVYKWLWDQK